MYSLIIFLLFGSIPRCLGSSEATVQKFIDHFKETIRSGSQEEISDMFSPSFVLFECDKSWAKADLLKLLSDPSSQYTFILKSAQLVEPYIEFNVEIMDHGKAVFEVKSVLNESKNRLERANQVGCRRKRISRSVPEPVEMDPVGVQYVRELNGAVRAGNEQLISVLLAPSFVFKGCKKTYDRAEFLDLLFKHRGNSKFFIAIVATENNGQKIKMISGEVGNPYKSIKGTFDKQMNRMESAEEAFCKEYQKREF
ncbi:hypothetical protein L5515_000352 [Caenorhabditis briggsae]|uniref:NTF2-like domain-containing protein n=1 Tax=Caenorhabditis briggsae TaxID=6238 RepID=A0AAE9E1H5_CAEBR|nr:hypothetical protein L5515_000352 [Caenorhabditis briggsae]